jgi:hypothetical protein
MQRPIRYHRKRRYEDLLDNINYLGIGKQMQKCKRILAYEKIHIQLPTKLQRSKASNYHPQLSLNGTLQTTVHSDHHLLSSQTYNRHKKLSIKSIHRNYQEQLNNSPN